MTERIEYLTAETEAGRVALAEVQAHSYQTDFNQDHPEWSIVRIADGVPVAFILIDPDRIMHFPGCGLSYSFIGDVATHADYRWEGHFRGIMEEAFKRLKGAGATLVACHGRYQLYRRFGFEVFTYHSGIFITPELIEKELPGSAPEETREWISISESEFVLDDLLLVYRSRAENLEEARNCLMAAASEARRRHKGRILFEEPEAPSYGSTYPMHPRIETPLICLARSLGGRIVVQGSNPEEGSIPDADWIKILDPWIIFQQILRCREGNLSVIPEAAIWFDSEDKGLGIFSNGLEVQICLEPMERGEIVHWPLTAIAQLVTGYRTAEVLKTFYGTRLSSSAEQLLQALFPPTWRFSRNESWTYKT